MRLLFVSYTDIDEGYGDSWWLFQIAKYLSKNHEIMILKGKGTKKTDYSRSLEELGVKLKNLSFIIGTSFPHPFDIIRLYKEVKENDVTYFLFAPGGIELVILLLSKLTRKKCVVGHHQPLDDPRLLEISDSKRRFYYKIFGYRSSKIALKFGLHHVINRVTGKFLEDSGVSKVWIIPNFIGKVESDFKSLKTKGKLRISYVGRLSPAKGIDDLITFCKEITSRISNLEINIIGDGELKSLLASSVPKHNVRLRGYISDREEILRIVGSSHVSVITSKVEEFSNAGLESLAVSTPVVSFKLPGPSEFIEDGRTGYLVDDVKEMVFRTSCILNNVNENRYYEMCKNCENKSKEFSLENLGPLFERMLVS